MSGVEWILRHGRGRCPSWETGTRAEEDVPQQRHSRGIGLLTAGKPEDFSSQQSGLWKMFTAQINTKASPEAGKDACVTVTNNVSLYAEFHQAC